MPGLIDPAGTAAAVGSLLGGAGQFLKDIRTALTGKEPLDATKAAELALKAQDLELQAMNASNALLTGQMDINKVEAASTNLFIAGWRPALGWTCAAIFAYNYIIAPLLMLIPGVMLPALDFGAIMPVLLGMLGLGGLRSYEKVKGAAGNH
jgi:hypothetical protein